MAFQDVAATLPGPKPLDVKGCALFLDLDGTLAPIAARPQDVRPDPRRTATLLRLCEVLNGRLAVVSGRTLADIDRILEGKVAAVAAVHGLVHRAATGEVQTARPHASLPAATDAFRRFAIRDSGLLVEEKGLSVALHFRLAPSLGAEARKLAQQLAAETGLVLQRGDMVEELRTPGPTKGDSVRTFIGRAPFAGHEPVFVGDDATDEEGFAAAEALGGFGVLVGPMRPTAAKRRLAGVEETAVWLEAAL